MIILSRANRSVLQKKIKFNYFNILIGKNHLFLQKFNFMKTSSKAVHTKSKFCGFNSVIFSTLMFFSIVVSGIKVQAQSSTIAAPTTSPTALPLSICPGTGFSVSFSTTGTFNPGNNFQVQLSTASGSFGSGTTIIGSGSSSPISVTVPITVTNSNVYRIRVVSSNPSVNGSSTTTGQFIVLSRPTSPTATGGSRCGTGTVSLSSSGCSTTRWYTASTGGTLVGSSAGLTTPSISATSQFFATCVGSNGCESIRTSATATVNPLPTVTGFSPSSGTIDVDAITVTGTNLSGLTGVSFNGTAAVATDVSSTSFTAVVPIGATTGPISATTACGTATSTASFTVIKPTIDQPTSSMPSGTYSNGFFTTLSCSTPDVSIYYTTNGNSPVVGSSFTKLYEDEAIFIPQTGTLRAIGFRNGWTTSSIMIRSYTVTNPTVVAKPVISPATGTYSGGQLVTITCSTPSSTIWFTTNGQIPVPFVNTPIRYRGPFSVIRPAQTIRAIATREDWVDSPIGASFITLSPSGTALSACTFSPLPGTYGTAQTVTISNADPLAQIRYTLDGTDPFRYFPLSRTYSGPLAINQTRTLKAYAIRDGFGDSPATVGIYTIGSLRQAVDNSADPANNYYTVEMTYNGMGSSESGLSADLSVGDKDTYNIYPNPSTGTIYLDYGVARENVEVVIYNQLGVEAGRFSTKEACFGALYTIENKQSGVYFVKIKDASGKIKERKLVIQ
jgi:hypothetical protein